MITEKSGRPERSARREEFDVVVCGGGLAGLCAAIASARGGARTCIVQDRPVFGGNSSSEVRVTPHGAAAFHAYGRETGIISELLIEERAHNHAEIFENGWTNSVWDLVMYQAAAAEPNLSFYLNTVLQSVDTDEAGREIRTVTASTLNAETTIELSARLFVDATGDGLLAHLAGCSWRMGSESKAEFGELHAPAEASADTMGNSIHFKTVDTGRPVSFTAPDWAVRHENPDYFYEQGRKPKDVRGGFWWIEIGVPYDTITDAEKIRHELTRHTLGVWDWMKNRDPQMRERTATYALEWIGQVPGKRESRRIMGEYFMTENDIQNRRSFDDEVAFGGWFLDLHTPGGLLAQHSEANSKENYSPYSDRAIDSYVGPYALPAGILVARDVDNLLMAGRDVSLTHAANGSVRVMGTCALLGQAAGTLAAEAVSASIPLTSVLQKRMGAVKQRLLRDGCFLLGTVNEDGNDLARRAVVTASSVARVAGCGPSGPAFHDGLSLWTDQINPVITDRLDAKRGQLIAVGPEGIDSLSVCLTNQTGRDEQVEAALYAVDHIWDYRSVPGAPIRSATLNVPAGKNRWVTWEVGIPAAQLPEQGAYVRLDLGSNPNLVWHTATRVEPGLVSMFELGRGRMRCFQQGVTMSFRVEPAQTVYAPGNVINGVTRPYRGVNLWRSDPQLPLEQWIELAWDRPVEIATVELTFAGNLLREYHAYAPLYRDAQCVSDYRIAVAGSDGEWTEVVEVVGNYQRRRVHNLGKPTPASRVRVTVQKTNGDPSAAVYEIRCYGRE
ncbi:FAD-dependent oxidoreductase [Salinispira pacifica]